MLAPKAPRSPLSTKPNVVQIVSQKQTGAVDPHLLIVEKKPARPKPVEAVAQAEVLPSDSPRAL
ncbi:hypothetical protein [Rugamonas sp.]|uniref:hypothetical protein n=1 Tax=Rugamonas sp. TaxID=1926287 RepID=UPI0025E25BBE|nr:hypothetical protein [Rugamonas sp.]